MIIRYKVPFLFSIKRKSAGLDKDLHNCVSEQFIKDTERALEIFFSSPSPAESIDQVKTILVAFKTDDINFKKYVSSFEFLPRIISLSDSFTFSDSIEEFQGSDSITFDFESISPVLELIDLITSEKTELINPYTLKLCFDLLNAYFEQNMLPNYLQSIHFLMKCFLNHICNESIDEFDENFIDKIMQFVNKDYRIHLDIAQIAEKMSIYLPRLDQKYRYFINFIKDLCERSNRDTSYPIILSLKNIVKKCPSFINSNESWQFKAIIDFSLSFDYKTQAISFEICSLLHHKNIVSSFLLDGRVKNSIESIITDFTDIRLIPVIHALTHFLKLDLYNCTKAYIAKKGFEQLSPCLIQYIIEGSFDLKVDAGYLLSELMKHHASMFINGMSNELSDLFQSQNADLKSAILIILDIDDDGYNDLLILMLNGLHVLCKECDNKYSDKVKIIIQNEFAESGIFDRIDALKNNSDSEDICTLCQSIFNCFDFETEEED